MCERVAVNNTPSSSFFAIFINSPSTTRQQSGSADQSAPAPAAAWSNLSHNERGVDFKKVKEGIRIKIRPPGRQITVLWQPLSQSKKPFSLGTINQTR